MSTLPITDQELLDDLFRVTKLLDHPPSYEEMRELGKYGPRTYQRRLGPTWDHVKRRTGWIPKYEQFEPQKVSPVDGAWLSGIIDGEGCFTIKKALPGKIKNSKSFSVTFCLSIRKDDIFIVNEIKRIIGTKTKVHIDNNKSDIQNGIKANPASKISVIDLPTLLFHLIPILEMYPLRSKKSRELPLFRLALQILFNKWKSGAKNLAYTDEERDALQSIYFALQELKQYNADYDLIIKKHNLISLLDDCSHLCKGLRPKKGPSPLT